VLADPREDAKRRAGGGGRRLSGDQGPSGPARTAERHIGARRGARLGRR
jgi:hypothetical protein